MATYIANNAAAIPDYSERWHNGERISTAFVKSTVNLVVSRRFAKKQQMQWSKQGAHRLLQTRTKALDGTLRDLFTTWYPAMAVNDNKSRLSPLRPDHLPSFDMLPSCCLLPAPGIAKTGKNRLTERSRLESGGMAPLRSNIGIGKLKA